jgi:hypothetical protein
MILTANVTQIHACPNGGGTNSSQQNELFTSVERLGNGTNDDRGYYMVDYLLPNIAADSPDYREEGDCGIDHGYPPMEMLYNGATNASPWFWVWGLAWFWMGRDGQTQCSALFKPYGPFDLEDFGKPEKEEETLQELHEDTAFLGGADCGSHASMETNGRDCTTEGDYYGHDTTAAGPE